MIRTNTFDKLYILLGLPWLFLVIFTSRMYTEIKIGLLAALMFLCVLEILGRGIRIESTYRKFVITFMFYCTLSLCVGILGGYPFSISNDFALLQYYYITPICVILFATVFNGNIVRKEYLWKVIVCFTFFLTILNTLRVSLFIMGIDPPYLQFLMMASIGTDDSSLTLRVSNEGSLFFLLPIFIYLVINTDNKRYVPLYLAIVVIGSVYAILSGRKMLELLIVVAAFFAMVFKDGSISFARLFSYKRIKIYIILLFGLFCVQFLLQDLSRRLGLDDILGMAYRTITEGLSSEAYGVTKRTENADALINLWLESPIWGNGLNSFAKSSIASDTTKWSYEVFAQAWLAQTGIIGVIFLLSPIKYLYKKLKKQGLLRKDNRYNALLVGFICFIIGGLSNPLLYFVWPWSIALIFCSEDKKGSTIIVK